MFSSIILQFHILPAVYSVMKSLRLFFAWRHAQDSPAEVSREVYIYTHSIYSWLSTINITNQYNSWIKPCRSVQLELRDHRRTTWSHGNCFAATSLIKIHSKAGVTPQCLLLTQVSTQDPTGPHTRPNTAPIRATAPLARLQNSEEELKLHSHQGH